jgi:hypothetical protein
MPAPVDSRIKVVKEWCTAQERKVVPVLLPKLEKQARAALAKAYAALETADFNDDERQGAWFVLSLLEYQVDKLYASPQQLALIFANARQKYERPPMGPVSLQLRNAKLLMLLISGERLGLCQLSPPEFAAIAGKIGDSLRDVQFWYYMSSWAFTHRNIDYLSQAFEAMLLMPTTFRNEYPFKRTRLMTHILRGQIKREQLLDYLDKIVIPQELTEFNQHFLPELKKLGMIDSEIDSKIESTAQLLAEQYNNIQLDGE